MRCPRILVALLFVAIGCDHSTPPAPRPPAESTHSYAVWEVRTQAEMQTLLTVKGCQGWRLAQVLPDEDGFVVIVEIDGPPPPEEDTCPNA